jgi:hypothetical protein
LAEHPDQRRRLVEDPTLIPKAVEELVRFEPPAPHVARYVTRDVEIHGTTVPACSRVALEEILKRFPEWEVDLPNAVFSTTSTIRGWDSMPAFVG